MSTTKTERAGKRRRSPHLSVVDDRPLWSRLTSRAVVLLLVAAALVMSLAFPIREFVAQRAEISALQNELATYEDRVAALKEQQEQWADPAYVEQQARDRLHYVFPGETGLVLLSPDDMKQARKAEVPVVAPPEVAWYDTLWSSVAAADSE